MINERVLKNTLKGSFYENVPIKDYKIDKTMKESYPGTDVDVEVIKTGEINFVFDDTHYRIVVNEGYFSLFVKEGSQLSEGSSHYIGTRVRVHDGAYWPAQDAVTYDDRQKQKKAAAIYMGGNKLEVG